MQVCGGVARSVFQPAFSEYDLGHKERNVDDAITELKASAVADVVANVGAASTSKISDRLLHIT